MSIFTAFRIGFQAGYANLTQPSKKFTVAPDGITVTKTNTATKVGRKAGQGARLIRNGFRTVIAAALSKKVALSLKQVIAFGLTVGLAGCIIVDPVGTLYYAFWILFIAPLLMGLLGSVYGEIFAAL